MKASSFIVGIAGGTASGKTTLARALQDILGPQKAVTIEIDRYYRSRDSIPASERRKINYDHPEALEFPLLIDQLKKLKGGTEIFAPEYNFAEHSRYANRDTLITPKPIIIVEGILALAHPELLQMYDLKIFVDTPTEDRFYRRFERDRRERGRTAAEIEAQWHSTVLPMHLKFCEPSRTFAHIVVSGLDDVSTFANSLASTVSERAKNRRNTSCTQ